MSFSLNTVTENLLREPDFQALAPSVATLLGALPSRTFTYVVRCLVRIALFGQFVKDDVTTTWYRVRWTDELPSADPRTASVAECMELLERAAVLLVSYASTSQGRAALDTLAKQDRIEDGVPIDYVDRNVRPIHRATNIHLIDPSLIDSVVQQRKTLLDKDSNPAFSVFEPAYKKIRVKTYKTDRVLTGDHKTNRELRWEAHPDSVHFALKEDCIRIEQVLVSQLCHLSGIPADLKAYLIGARILGLTDKYQLCPVTLDPLRWEEFQKEMSSADHGRSDFQVGHLNPLKSNPDRNPEWGHSYKNVSWISADGNRIQGHLSLVETRDLLERIARNYKEQIDSVQ